MTMSMSRTKTNSATNSTQ